MSWNKLEDSPFEVKNNKVTFEADKLGKYAIKKHLDDQVKNTTYLYYLGTENIDLVGSMIEYYGGSMITKTLTKNADNLYSSLNGSGDGGSAGWKTTNSIDFNGYIGVVLKSTQSGSGPYHWADIYILNGSTALDRYNLDNSGIHYQELKVASRTLNNNLAISGTAGGGSRQTSNWYMLALVKQDNISGLSAYGSDISSILSNSALLLNDSSAVNYMVANCTGEFMWKALINSTFLSAYTASPYKSTIDNNSCWKKALDLL